MSWITATIQIIMAIIKMIFGTDQVQKNTVVRPKQEIEITDGKSDEERLKDCGM